MTKKQQIKIFEKKSVPCGMTKKKDGTFLLPM